MKIAALLTAAFAASASARVLEARQRRTSTTRPSDPGPTESPDLEKCGLDSFLGHLPEALKLCTAVLQSGTVTRTTTVTSASTTTVRITTYTTLYPTSTPKPPTSKPPTSTPKPPTSTPKPPTSTPKPPTSTPTKPTPTPTPTPGPGCGIVGYTKDTAAYYFDSSGTKNTFASCKAACVADSKCKSFGYGEANCMLFDVTAAANTNINPMSPYTFYDASCPAELPVHKRQINITTDPAGLSSACLCLITSAPGGTTKWTSTTITGKATTTQTVTRTVSLLPDDRAH